MENQIVLQNTSKGLTATFYGPKAEDIVRLFGTYTLPMPFSVDYAEDAIALVERNWPGWIVDMI